MDFDITRINSEDLVEIKTLDLSDYIGVPVLVFTPNYEHFYQGSKLVSIQVKPTYHWIVFNGDVKITPETKEQKFFTFNGIKIK